MIVIIHGYDGSGPGHWQHWLKNELTAQGVPVLFPELPEPLEPKREAWLDSLSALLAGVQSEVTFVAHSLGVWAVDHFLSRHGAKGIRGALLVAPPSPYSLFEPIQSFLPPPRSKSAWAQIREKSLLLGSDNDDYAGDDEVLELGRTIDVDCRILPGAGHINAAAGFGPFPLALDWLRQSGAVA